MNTTKHLILGALSCLLLGVGFANVGPNSVTNKNGARSDFSSGLLSRTTVPIPGGDGPKMMLSRTTVPIPGGDGPKMMLSRTTVPIPGGDGPRLNLMQQV